MRLKVTADTLAEQLGLWSGMLPTPLVHVTFGMGYARSIVAGARLGVFEALGQGSMSVPELARATGCSQAGIAALSAALVGAELLRRRGDQLENTAVARKWLVPGVEGALPEVVLFLGYCQELLVDLEEQVRTGQVQRLHEMEHPPEFWKAYMGALGSFAKLASKEVVRRYSHDGPLLRLLDLGGGHGMFSCALVRRNEGLVAEVLDLPEACEAARPLVEAEGLSERVLHRPGDFRKDPLGEGYDMALIFNVLHNATEEEARGLIERAHAALRPGGTLLVCDAVHQGETADLDMNAGWNELFFFVISGAQAWPEPTVLGWLDEAGFELRKRAALLSLPNFLISAVKR